MKYRTATRIMSMAALWLLLHGLAATAQPLPDAALEERLSARLHLKDLLTYAYEFSPAIEASRESWNAFIENYRVGTSYPDPQLMTTFFPRPIETRLGPQDYNLTLSQAIPFPGRLTQKGKVLKSEAAIARLTLDKTVRDIVTSVSRSFYELLYIEKAISVAKANLNINKQIAEISETAYAEDQTLFYDVSKARAQTAQIRYDLIVLEDLLDTERAKLNTLLNRPPEAPLGQAVEVPVRPVVYTLDQIYALAARFQEDILIADQRVAKARDGVTLAQFENLPTFKLGLFYAGIGRPDTLSQPRDAGRDAVGIQAGLSLPIWFGKNSSRTSKAKALSAKARAEKQVTVNTVHATISRLWYKLQNSKRLIDLYEKEMLPQARASLATADTWARENQKNLSDYLEVQATAYNFELALARAKTDYAQTLSTLEQMAGVILDRKHTDKEGTHS